MPKILQVKISLQGASKPPIWRQVLLPVNINFQQLHGIIQGAMGWHNAHLYEFNFGRQHRSIQIGIPHLDDFGDTKDASKVKISKYLSAEKDWINYDYDFGDGWQHIIQVQKILAAEKGMTYPHLLKGKGACPHEDCGGIWGYYNMVEAINDPEHESHEDMVEWTGVEHWDVNEFDLEARRAAMMDSFHFAKQRFF